MGLTRAEILGKFGAEQDAADTAKWYVVFKPTDNRSKRAVVAINLSKTAAEKLARQLNDPIGG